VIFGVPEAAVRVDITASPERVWELVTDISLMPRFSTELLSTAWGEGFAGPELGAQFLGTNRHPAIGEWTTRSEIIEREPARAGEIVRRRLAQFEAGMRATVAGLREIAEG